MSNSSAGTSDEPYDKMVRRSKWKRLARNYGVANRLSEIRILLTVVAASMFYYVALQQTPTWWSAGSGWWFFLAAVVFTVAGLLDLADGKVARWSESVTAYGKFIDPLSDKVLNYTMLGLICGFFYPGLLEYRDWYLVFVLMACLDLYSTNEHFRDFLKALKTGKIKESTGSKLPGKIKMWAQIFAIVPHLLLWWPELGVIELFGYQADPLIVAQSFAFVCLEAATYLAVRSLWEKYQSKKTEEKKFEKEVQRDIDLLAKQLGLPPVAEACTNEGSPNSDDITPVPAPKSAPNPAV